MKSKKLFICFTLALSNLIIPIAPLAADHLVMAVVGQNYSGTQPPVLATLANDHSHWSVQMIPGLPTHGRFLSASCTGKGMTAMCTAVGHSIDNNLSPLLVMSNNGGKNWIIPTLPKMLPYSSFNSTSCTGSGNNAVCSVTGHNAKMNIPLLITSIDGGSNWITPLLEDSLKGYFFNSTSCAGRGNNAICIVAGAYQDDSQPPILVTSIDGGRNFTLQPITGLPAEGFLMGTSCTGEDSTAICVSVGGDVTHHRPLLVVSKDGGHNWDVQTISNLSFDGFLMSASCTGEGSTAICTTVGKDITNHKPLLAVSTDGSHHWVIPTIPGLSADGIFYSTSCTGNGNTAVCIAAGENLSTYAPLLVASTDGGNSWKIQTIPEAPVKGSYFTTSCINHDKTPLCIGAGENFITGAPLLVQSQHLLDWIMPTIDNLPWTGGFYGAGSA